MPLRPDGLPGDVHRRAAACPADGRPLEEIEDAAVWDALYEKLALGLVNLAQLTRVEVVALSGSIALKHEGFLDALRERVEDRLRGMTLRLELATLGEQAPLVGAALLPETPERAILHELTVRARIHRS